MILFYDEHTWVSPEVLKLIDEYQKKGRVIVIDSLSAMHKHMQPPLTVLSPVKPMRHGPRKAKDWQK